MRSIALNRREHAKKFTLASYLKNTYIYTWSRGARAIHACYNAREIPQCAEFGGAMTHVCKSGFADGGSRTHVRMARARNRRAWSTDRDDGERGRLRRGVGVYRLGVPRLSNAQGIRVRVRVGLMPRRAEAQAETQHQQRHRADQQVTRPGHRALPWNRWHPSVIDSTRSPLAKPRRRSVTAHGNSPAE